VITSHNASRALLPAVDSASAIAMGRQTIAAAFAVAGAMLAAPAAAQFGSIFGEPAPRPPQSVPGGRQQSPSSHPAPAPVQPPPPADYPAPGGPYGGIQSQSLPPPAGAAVEPAARTTQPPPAALPPGQRQLRGAQPTDTAPQPGDEVIAEPPQQKIVNSAALFSGLDKITGRIISFDVNIGETVQFGALQLTPRACYTRPATETSNTDAFVEVDEVTLQGEVRRIFTGWMFAASPGLHAVEHPIYDLWLTDCKGGAQAAAEKPAEPPPATAPAPRPQQRAQPKQQQRQPAQQSPFR
jgi:hypothetical protein